MYRVDDTLDPRREGTDAKRRKEIRDENNNEKGTTKHISMKSIRFLQIGTSVCIETDMEKVVNCAECGKPMKYGESFTSQRIYDSAGLFGYAVGRECHESGLKDRIDHEREI